MGTLVAEKPDTVRGPDVAVVRRDRAPSGRSPGFVRGAPDLAVEVVSPSNTAVDLHKVVEHLEARGCVWVVYPTTRTVVVHDSVRTATLFSEDELLPAGNLLPGLSITVADLFRD